MSLSQTCEIFKTTEDIILERIKDLQAKLDFIIQVLKDGLEEENLEEEEEMDSEEEYLPKKKMGKKNL